MPPNVVLIVFDTARADAFEPYGAGSGATPVVGDLSRRGSALPLAYAPSNWTLPSHVSMLTGLLPRESGLAQAPGGKAANVRAYIEAMRPRLLPEVLRKAGYVTRAASSNAWITTTTGFAAGFDEFHDVRSARKQPPSNRPRLPYLRWILETARADDDDGADQIERLMSSWMDAADRHPFFWLVNLVECHSPYLPPRPYNDVKGRARLEAAADIPRYQTLQAVWRFSAGRRPIPADALARMRHLYGRSIRALDDWLGRLLERMDRKGLLDETLVIVTSDHGENLGESDLIGHAFSLDERLIHIPLVVVGPGAFSSDEALSLVEIPGLIARAAGLSEHPWPDANGARGVVVSQYDALTGPDDPRVAQAAAMWGLDDEGIARLTARGTAATDGRMKLVREGGVERAYDLGTDPLETSPIAPNGIERLRSALDRAERQTPVVNPTGSVASREETEDLEERLKLLGYL